MMYYLIAVGLAIPAGMLIGWCMGHWNQSEQKRKIAEQARAEGKKEGNGEGWKAGHNSALQQMSDFIADNAQ